MIMTKIFTTLPVCHWHHSSICKQYMYDHGPYHANLSAYLHHDICWITHAILDISHCRTCNMHPINGINSLVPGQFEWNFRHVIFKQSLVIDDWGISCGIALTWKPQDLADDKSTLVRVMAWCHQATSHYLSQSWPSSLSPYGVTGPQ